MPTDYKSKLEIARKALIVARTQEDAWRQAAQTRQDHLMGIASLLTRVRKACLQINPILETAGHEQVMITSTATAQITEETTLQAVVNLCEWVVSTVPNMATDIVDVMAITDNIESEYIANSNSISRPLQALDTSSIPRGLHNIDERMSIDNQQDDDSEEEDNPDQ